MSCNCELCTVRKKRSLDHLRVSRKLVKQQTLPVQADMERSRLPAWTQGLKERSYSEDCKYDSDEENDIKSSEGTLFTYSY